VTFELNELTHFAITVMKQQTVHHAFFATATAFQFLEQQYWGNQVYSTVHLTDINCVAVREGIS